RSTALGRSAPAASAERASSALNTQSVVYPASSRARRIRRATAESSSTSRRRDVGSVWLSDNAPVSGSGDRVFAASIGKCITGMDYGLLAPDVGRFANTASTQPQRQDRNPVTAPLPGFGVQSRTAPPHGKPLMPGRLPSNRH